jgi:uncharacterized protein YceH (UPF0502 family)
MELTAQEGRVLGALVEKELTTPQGYPLTDNALLAACNQTTSRDPVVAYDVGDLRTAVRSLREQGLLRTVHRPGERSSKHRHELPEALGLSPAQVAVLAVLLLRGPQTAAELRARTERMHPFGSAEEVEQVLADLAGRDQPLAQRLERQPGRKEPRWVQRLAAGPAGAAPLPAAAPVEQPDVDAAHVVRELLAAVDQAVAARDVEAALALFTGDAVLLGSGPGESPVGQDELRVFLSGLLGQPSTAAWEGDDLTVGDAAGVVWFLLVGELVLRGERERRRPARLSAVLVPQGGTYRMAQLHVSEPARGNT